jgi:hypothetical protein
MAQGSQSSAQISRVFEQPADAVSFYSDFAQVLGTGVEVVIQFYETIPGSPGPGGQIQMVRSRLRSTITISKAHAMNLGRTLLQHAGVTEAMSPKLETD